MADGGRLPSRGGKLRSRDGEVRLFLPVPRSTKSLIPPSLSPVLFTHSVTCSLTVLMSIMGALAAEIAEAAAVVVAVVFSASAVHGQVLLYMQSSSSDLRLAVGPGHPR